MNDRRQDPDAAFRSAGPTDRIRPGLLRKVHGALVPGGRVVVLEFVPNEDRVSPPMAARFSLTMLSNTPEGDAYTFSELRRMLLDAGFRETTLHALPGAHSVVLGVK